jgi:hypothetical protein
MHRRADPYVAENKSEVEKFRDENITKSHYAPQLSNLKSHRKRRVIAPVAAFNSSMPNRSAPR